MAIHWQVKFRSLRAETLYTVNIYDDSYTGTPVQLTGAAQPFETQEDDDDDIFVPVRLQSGYLRIRDTGKDADGNAFNWRELIPATDTDRPVTLTDGDGKVMWQGFLQAQNFGFSLYENPQERALPLQCPLTVLSRYNNTYYKQDNIQNFAYLLKIIVNSIPATCRPTSFVIQGGSDAQAWLLKKIDWQLFFEENKEWEATLFNTGFEGEPQPRFNLLEVLENMCRFWGWTARTCQSALYLTCVDAQDVTGFLTLDNTQLAQMALGYSDGTIDAGFIPAGFVDDIYVSTDNQDFQMRGPNKAVVTSDVSAGNDAVIVCYPDGVMSRLLLLGFDSSQVLYSYAENSKTAIETSLMKATGSSNGDFSVLQIWPTLNREEEIHPVVRIKSAYNGSVIASLETKKMHSFSYGRIKLSGVVYKNGEVVDDADQDHWGNKFMVVRIGVGASRNTARWFRGKPLYGETTDWYDWVTECRARIGGNDDTLYISPTDDTSVSSYLPTDGLLGGPSGVMYGKIFIDFLGSSDPDLTVFDIADFKVTFEREKKSWRYDDPDRRESHNYKSANANNTEDEWSDTVIFSSENYSRFGYGVVLNTDYSYFEGYGYGGSLALTPPEQHLADRVVNYWATSKRKMVCRLRKDKTMLLTPKVKGVIDGTNVWPLSVGHNWSDDTEDVKFIELQT